ncbi:MAG: DHHA1 domain-containing protein, partial [Longimicrobiales bacterium]
RVRGSARIEFLCGMRAVRRARADFDALSGIAAALSSSLDDAPARVAATADQLREAERSSKRLGDELSAYRARARYDAAVPDPDGVRRIVQRVRNAEFDEAKAIAHVLTEMARVVYLVTVDEPARVLLATSEDSGVDAGATLRRLLSEVSGRGGGSARLAQGSVPDAAAAEAIRAAVDSR